MGNGRFFTVAAMSAAGIITACTFAGATDTPIFVAFVEQFLAPGLKPDQVVVLDNLPAHRSPQIDKIIASAQARVLRLPAYSPDLIPLRWPSRK